MALNMGFNFFNGNDLEYKFYEKNIFGGLGAFKKKINKEQFFEFIKAIVLDKNLEFFLPLLEKFSKHTNSEKFKILAEIAYANKSQKLLDFIYGNGILSAKDKESIYWTVICNRPLAEINAAIGNAKINNGSKINDFKKNIHTLLAQYIADDNRELLFLLLENKVPYQLTLAEKLKERLEHENANGEIFSNINGFINNYNKPYCGQVILFKIGRIITPLMLTHFMKFVKEYKKTGSVVHEFNDLETKETIETIKKAEANLDSDYEKILFVLCLNYIDAECFNGKFFKHGEAENLEILHRSFKKNMKEKNIFFEKIQQYKVITDYFSKIHEGLRNRVENLHGMKL